MATTIEYSLLAGAAYYDTRNNINRFPVPKEWNVTSRVPQDSATGFEAAAYINSTTNEIVISFAGTYDNPMNPLTNPDMQADIGLATGFGSAQLLQAAEYYLQVKAANASNPKAHITLTGHSLGGGLAALVGVFFGVEATTFDQAPFANSAQTGLLHPDVAAKLKSDLLFAGYSEDDLVDLANFLQLRATDGGIPNSNLISNIRVDGEFLSTIWPSRSFDTIGQNPPTVFDHGSTDNLLSGFDLHSMALLTAFMQSDQSAAASGQTLSEATKKLTSLLGMFFDKQLFANDTDPTNTTKVNLLEDLIQHQNGPDPTVPDMLDCFTSDMWKIAQDGGLTMNSNIDKVPTAITNTLIVFAMQAYYGDRLAVGETLFKSVEGGIHFDRTKVSDTLDDGDGNDWLNGGGFVGDNNDWNWRMAA